MGTFWKTFLGTFFGKLSCYAFIAVCLLLGFGPDEWASFMIATLSPAFSPLIAQTLFLMLGFSAFWFLTVSFVESAKKNNTTAEINYEAWDLLNELKLEDVIGFLSGGSPYGADYTQKDVYERMFKASVESGELKLKSNYREWERSNYGGYAFVELIATRENLIEYMKKKGLKPPFLFPEERR